jgi:hypothetical protein
LCFTEIRFKTLIGLFVASALCARLCPRFALTPETDDDSGDLSVGTHEILITEPHPCRRGFFRRLYARVEVTHTGDYWVWRQIDENGIALTDAEHAFETEDAALNDAVRQLHGVAVAF